MASTRYRARQHDIAILQWGVDYWDPNSNAETFAVNPNNADDSQLKTLAWRNAWDVPAELQEQSKAALLERDCRQAQRRCMATLQKKVREQGPFTMLWQQTEVAGLRKDVRGFTARADLRHRLHRTSQQITDRKAPVRCRSPSPAAERGTKRGAASFVWAVLAFRPRRRDHLPWADRGDVLHRPRHPGRPGAGDRRRPRAAKRGRGGAQAVRFRPAAVEQFFFYVKKALTGDFGNSVLSTYPVMQDIRGACFRQRWSSPRWGR